MGYQSVQHHPGLEAAGAAALRTFVLTDVCVPQGLSEQQKLIITVISVVAVLMANDSFLGYVTPPGGPHPWWEACSEKISSLSGVLGTQWPGLPLFTGGYGRSSRPALALPRERCRQTRGVNQQMDQLGSGPPRFSHLIFYRRFCGSWSCHWRLLGTTNRLWVAHM